MNLNYWGELELDGLEYKSCVWTVFPLLMVVSKLWDKRQVVLLTGVFKLEKEWTWVGEGLEIFFFFVVL